MFAATPISTAFGTTPNGTFFNFFDYGEASLAMFLLVLQTFLDDCELGPTKIINYADFVHKPDGPKPVG